jgi:8-oxo-dGTP diphosphatase
VTEHLARPVRGVVAVVVRQQKLLVIERSQLVRAPGMFCFPGGAIEEGESEPAAVARELLEELSLVAMPVRLLFSSVTPWGVSLSWWLAQTDEQLVPLPNPAEVASFDWRSVAEFRQLDKLLASNLEFLDAWQRGEFAIDGLTQPKPISSQTSD